MEMAGLTNLVQSIYKVMGTSKEQAVQEESAEERAKDIFKQMDRDGDGRVTRDVFVQTCLIDQRLIELLTPHTA